MAARARIRTAPARLPAHCPSPRQRLHQGPRQELRRRPYRWYHVLLAMLLCGSSLCPWRLPAQTAPGATDGAPYTLHVYQDLLQLPTLVLNRKLETYPGLTAPQFTLQLDSGPPFHPRHVRVQGDDPLQVALVLDTSQADTRTLAKTLAASSPGELASWLSPEDELSLYALDCHLIRSVQSIPYTAPRLHWTLTPALAAADLHKHGQGAVCGSHRKLWDSLASVVTQVGQLPGRRVIIVVTDGIDGSGQLSWKALAHYAGAFNITLMGLRTLPPELKISDPAPRTSAFFGPTGYLVRSDEEAFDLLCAGTGGLVLPVTPQSLTTQMNRLVQLLRNRYILEFPRPRNDVAALHQVDVSVPDPHAIVLAAGVAFPPRRPGLDAEPGTVPSDPTQAPQLGGRKILTQPR